MAIYMASHLRIIWLMSCGPSLETCMPLTRLMASASGLTCKAM